MIRRRALLVASAALLASAGLAKADEISGIVTWLRGLGFKKVEVTRSLLGRVQIRATGTVGVRELVVNPRTGEILRDVWVDGNGKIVRGASYPGSRNDDGHEGSKNSGRGGGDDDGGDDSGGDDDDSEDDDGDDGGDDGGDDDGGDDD
jgi:hypothetical protein